MAYLTRSILLASLSSLALASPAAAQTQGAAPAAAVPVADPGDEIIVTGTRRADRTVADSAVPIDVVSAESLSQSGHTEINRALTQEVPSFNFPQPAITDGTDVIRPATLRGLWPDQTLVLINGKRRHCSTSMDRSGAAAPRSTST